MKPLGLFTVAAGIAAFVSSVASAPVGVVVVTTDGHRILVPVADDETDPKGMGLSSSPHFFSPELVRIDGEMPEGDFPALMAPGIQMPPETGPVFEVVDEGLPVTDVHPHPHPPPMPLLPEHGPLMGILPGGCYKSKTEGKAVKYRKMMAHRMHHLMNKFRAALGLPTVKYHKNHDHHHHDHHHHDHHTHHHHHDGARMRYHPKVTSEVEMTSEESQSFLVRFERAVDSLSPWESRAVLFVLGLGLGSILRMFIVLGIIMVRGRRACRAGRRCGRRGFCRRRLTQDAEINGAATVPMPVEPAPPAYTDMINEKSMIAGVPVSAEASKQCKEILTVAIGASGNLEVWWATVDGTECVTPAMEFHKMYPQELIRFYESNLKWKPAEEESTDEK